MFISIIIYLCLSFSNLSAQVESPLLMGAVLAIRGTQLDVLKSDGKIIVAQIGTKLFGEDIIKTSSNTSARILMFDNSVLNIGPKTELKITKEQSILQLLGGKIRCIVAGILGTKKYKIEMASVTAGVRGTDFILDFEPEKGKINVYGLRGEVSMTSKTGQEHFIKPDISASLKVDNSKNNFEIKQESILTPENKLEVIKESGLDLKQNVGMDSLKFSVPELKKEGKKNRKKKFDKKAFDKVNGQLDEFQNRERNDRISKLRLRLHYTGKII